MRVLFLDVDGVLNSAAWVTSGQRPTRLRAQKMFPGGESAQHALRSLDPAAVKVLNEIVGRSGAQVVVSSTWRSMYPLTKLNGYLRYHGFEHLLFGATPDDTELQVTQGMHLSWSRSDEITAWLALLPEDLVGSRDYVILDDETVAGHAANLYHLDSHHGLRIEDLVPILEKFA